MNHQTLFDFNAQGQPMSISVDWSTGAVRRTDPDTSRTAARAQRGGTEKAIVAEFQRALRSGVRGLTDDELCARLPMFNPATVKTARSRLVKHHKVLEASGGCRESRCGQPMTVWRLVGREVAELLA